MLILWYGDGRFNWFVTLGMVPFIVILKSRLVGLILCY